MPIQLHLNPGDEPDEDRFRSIKTSMDEALDFRYFTPGAGATSLAGGANAPSITLLSSSFLPAVVFGKSTTGIWSISDRISRSWTHGRFLTEIDWSVEDATAGTIRVHAYFAFWNTGDPNNAQPTDSVNFTGDLTAPGNIQTQVEVLMPEEWPNSIKAPEIPRWMVFSIGREGGSDTYGSEFYVHGINMIWVEDRGQWG